MHFVYTILNKPSSEYYTFVLYKKKYKVIIRLTNFPIVIIYETQYISQVAASSACNQHVSCNTARDVPLSSHVIAAHCVTCQVTRHI